MRLTALKIFYSVLSLQTMSLIQDEPCVSALDSEWVRVIMDRSWTDQDLYKMFASQAISD